MASSEDKGTKLAHGTEYLLNPRRKLIAKGCGPHRSASMAAPGFRALPVARSSPIGVT